ELGGKSPNVVFADADLEQAVTAAYWGIFLNSGQACQAGSRLLVQREIHDEFVAALTELTQTSRIGDPLDEKTMLGPLVHGGRRLTDGPFARGLYVEPTIFDGVTGDMAIAREEIFGPVLSVLTFDD